MLKKHHELSATRKLGGKSLWRFAYVIWKLGLSFFQRLLDEAGYEDKHFVLRTPSLPLIGLAPFLAYCHPNLCTQTVSLSEFWSKVPQRNVELLNRVGPTGDTELDRRASDKTHQEFALGVMDGPYNSLEELPLGTTKSQCAGNLVWQSGDVRNIDDCSENGINETFESKETYKLASVDHHVSAIKLWEASLPGVKLQRVCCRFVETFQANWHWFEPSRGFLVP